MLIKLYSVLYVEKVYLIYLIPFFYKLIRHPRKLIWLFFWYLVSLSLERLTIIYINTNIVKKLKIYKYAGM